MILFLLCVMFVGHTIVMGSPSWRVYPFRNDFANDDPSSLNQQQQQSAEKLNQWQSQDVDYPVAREFKKMVQPFHFNEARLHPMETTEEEWVSPSRQDKPWTTSPSTLAHHHLENEKNNKRGSEGLWMKKSITLKKKREGRLSVEEQKNLLGELGNILKDDDRTQLKTISNVKRQANVSGLEDADGKEENPKSEHQKFEDWLKQEYLRNMALSFATAKKKKRSPADDQLFSTKQNKDGSGGLAREFFDPETLDVIKDRLKVIENTVLADAIQKIIVRAREDSVSDVSSNNVNGGGQKIANRLAEAYYIEKLKQTLDNLPHNWGKFREVETENQRAKKRGNLAEALPVMAPVDDKRQQIREEELVEEEFEDCPELQLLTSDCSALEGFLPNSPMTSTLRHFCNKHEVCYSCGEAFGLTSSDCDGLFLRDTMALCRASGLCRGDGDLLLQPLHERRVFYKRSVPAICYRAPCVQAFLMQQ